MFAHAKPLARQCWAGSGPVSEDVKQREAKWATKWEAKSVVSPYGSCQNVETPAAVYGCTLGLLSRRFFLTTFGELLFRLVIWRSHQHCWNWRTSSKPTTPLPAGNLFRSSEK